jgi:hypothetical protein
MTIATYAELQSTAADFLNRDDLTAVIPTFIRLAESRIDRDLRHYRQEKRSTAQLNAQYSAIPSDYLSTIRIQILDGATSEVQPISTAQMLQLRGDRFDLTGRPTHYALTAGGLELYPTPDMAYNISWVYYGRVAALSVSNTTNWLLTEAPDAYLYGALIHSAPYLKDDAKVALWDGLYKAAMDNLNSTSEDAKYSGSGLTMKTRRGAP